VKRLPLIALGLFVLGVLFMIPFEAWFTRVLGVGCLVGAIVAGVFAIATPEFLEAEEDEPA
jgi:hydroxyethylthiazole kinase-like sugar kinase family protein